MNEAKPLASAQTHNVLPDDPHRAANDSSNFSDHPELPADGSVEATLVGNGGSLPDGRSLVFNHDGVVFANSHDVAAFFGKRHDHVLRSIDLLSADMRALSAPGDNVSGNPGHPPNLGDGRAGRFREVRRSSARRASQARCRGLPRGEGVVVYERS